MLAKASLILALLLTVGLPSWSYEASRDHAHKMWYMGHVISAGDGEFSFRTRWHPNRMVQVSNSTLITCAKRTIPLSALHAEDLVEIKALADSSAIHGTKVTVHASNFECESRTSTASQSSRP